MSPTSDSSPGSTRRSPDSCSPHTFPLNDGAPRRTLPRLGRPSRHENRVPAAGDWRPGDRDLRSESLPLGSRPFRDPDRLNRVSVRPCVSQTVRQSRRLRTTEVRSPLRTGRTAPGNDVPTFVSVTRQTSVPPPPGTSVQGPNRVMFPSIGPTTHGPSRVRGPVGPTFTPGEGTTLVLGQRDDLVREHRREQCPTNTTWDSEC